MDLPHDSDVASILISDLGGLRPALRYARKLARTGHGAIAVQYGRVAEMLESRIERHYGALAAQSSRDGDPTTSAFLLSRALRETHDDWIEATAGMPGDERDWIG